MEIESGSDSIFRGKTGLGSQEGRAVGWLVGYVEREGRRWTYAALIRGRADADVDAEMGMIAPLRVKIARTLLTRADVLPPSSSL